MKTISWIPAFAGMTVSVAIDLLKAEHLLSVGSVALETAPTVAAPTGLPRCVSKL